MKKDIVIILVELSFCIAIYELYSQYLKRVEERAILFEDSILNKTKAVADKEIKISTSKDEPKATSSAWD